MQTLRNRMAEDIGDLLEYDEVSDAIHDLSGMNLSGRRVCRRLRSGLGPDVAVATSANVESTHRQSCLDDRSFGFRYIYITLLSCSLALGTFGQAIFVGVTL